eukprot:m.32208 g.32208  ORF g.32208 m.32208 type:complete len:377 (-) comp8385_c0_seq1:1410-2540(-)
MAEGLASAIGQPVLVAGKGEGILRFYGPHNKKKKEIYCGVEFSEPIGNCNGSVGWHKYFKCAKNHGVLVKEVEVTMTLLNDEKPSPKPEKKKKKKSSKSKKSTDSPPEEPVEVVIELNTESGQNEETTPQEEPAVEEGKVTEEAYNGFEAVENEEPNEGTEKENDGEENEEENDEDNNENKPAPLAAWHDGFNLKDEDTPPEPINRPIRKKKSSISQEMFENRLKEEESERQKEITEAKVSRLLEAQMSGTSINYTKQQVVSPPVHEKQSDRGELELERLAEEKRKEEAAEKALQIENAKKRQAEREEAKQKAALVQSQERKRKEEEEKQQKIEEQQRILQEKVGLSQLDLKKTGTNTLKRNTSKNKHPMLATMQM